MTPWLKRLARRLDPSVQQAVKRYRFARAIRRGTIPVREPEYHRLPEFVAEGDWTIDVGANIGLYTLRLSEIVKAAGRVVALEPVPPTFDLLASNCALAPHRNITLLNAAASDFDGVAAIRVPEWEPGGNLNFYEAALEPNPDPEPKSEAPPDNANVWNVLALRLDSLPFPAPVRFVKIDAEGHELPVLRGMARLLDRDRPTLVVEANHEAAAFLQSLGYRAERLERSPNELWRHPDPPRKTRP